MFFKVSLSTNSNAEGSEFFIITQLSAASRIDWYSTTKSSRFSGIFFRHNFAEI